MKLEESKDTLLAKRIARRAFLIGNRMKIEDDMSKLVRMQSALLILNQAQAVLDADSKESIKLYNVAIRLSS